MTLITQLEKKIEPRYEQRILIPKIQLYLKKKKPYLGDIYCKIIKKAISEIGLP